MSTIKQMLEDFDVETMDTAGQIDLAAWQLMQLMQAKLWMLTSM